jgi:hypothetical protein
VTLLKDPEEHYWFRKQLKSISFANEVLRYIDVDSQNYTQEQLQDPKKKQNKMWWDRKKDTDLVWDSPRANAWIEYALPKMVEYGYPKFAALPSGKKPPKDLDWDLLGQRDRQLFDTKQSTMDHCGGQNMPDDIKRQFDSSKTCAQNYIAIEKWGQCQDDGRFRDKQNHKCEWYYTSVSASEPALCDVLHGLAIDETKITALANPVGKVNAMRKCCRCMSPTLSVAPDKHLYDVKFVNEGDMLYLGKFTSKHTVEEMVDLGVVTTLSAFFTAEKERRKLRQDQAARVNRTLTENGQRSS